MDQRSIKINNKYKIIRYLMINITIMEVRKKNNKNKIMKS